MASLWTPEGEHRIENNEPGASAPAFPPPSDLDGGHFDGGPFDNEPNEEQVRAELAAMERELLSAPVEAIIANHCYGFFQLAAMHLSQHPPHLADASVAIDALAAVVDTLGDRLGDTASTLNDALAQIRLAFVQISAAQPSANAANGAHGEAGEAPSAN